MIGMSPRLHRIARLFTIKNRFEAYAIIFALATGAVERGEHYLRQYQGFSGWLLFIACCLTVMMAGAKILDGVPRHSRKRAVAP